MSQVVQYNCTHKRTEWNEWLPREVVIIINYPLSLITVQEIKNAKLEIQYENHVIQPIGETYFLFENKVVCMLPPPNTRPVITIFADNYLCPTPDIKPDN